MKPNIAKREFQENLRKRKDLALEVRALREAVCNQYTGNRREANKVISAFISDQKEKREIFPIRSGQIRRMVKSLREETKNIERKLNRSVVTNRIKEEFELQKEIIDGRIRMFERIYRYLLSKEKFGDLQYSKPA